MYTVGLIFHSHCDLLVLYRLLCTLLIMVRLDQSAATAVRPTCVLTCSLSMEDDATSVASAAVLMKVGTVPLETAEMLILTHAVFPFSIWWGFFVCAIIAKKKASVSKNVFPLP